MAKSITDVKEIERTSDLGEVNSLLASGNWILVDTQHVVPDESLPNDIMVLFILGRVR